MGLLYGGQVVAAAPDSVKVCFNYGCKARQNVPLKGVLWKKVRKVFAQRFRNPAEEREGIRQAVALMEQLAGYRTGTSADKARNTGTGERGQMDCIDESTNTTTYLRLFEKKGWLRRHNVKERKFRRPFLFDDHWGAVIEEKSSGALFVVDSWYLDNGQPPFIQPMDQWMRKIDPVPAASNKTTISKKSVSTVPWTH